MAVNARPEVVGVAPRISRDAFVRILRDQIAPHRATGGTTTS